MRTLGTVRPWQRGAGARRRLEGSVKGEIKTRSAWKGTSFRVFLPLLGVFSPQTLQTDTSLCSQ